MRISPSRSPGYHTSSKRAWMSERAFGYGFRLWFMVLMCVLHIQLVYLLHGRRRWWCLDTIKSAGSGVVGKLCMAPPSERQIKARKWHMIEWIEVEMRQTTLDMKRYRSPCKMTDVIASSPFGLV